MRLGIWGFSHHTLSYNHFLLSYAQLPYLARYSVLFLAILFWSLAVFKDNVPSWKPENEDALILAPVTFSNTDLFFLDPGLISLGGFTKDTMRIFTHNFLTVLNSTP